ARTRYTRLAPRLRFEHQSIFQLDETDRTFDLTVNRHVIHSIPHPERVLAELVRVTRPGGYLHLIPEDYGMIHFEKTEPDPKELWNTVTSHFAAGSGSD